jgi:hypothetical protein
MKVFYDTEFIDDGRTIDLISIGMVAEDGREYYAVSSEFDVDALHANKWLVDNVWPHLPLIDRSDDEYYGCLNTDHPAVKPRAEIAAEALEFLLTDGYPELWAWYAAYDHVALAQLWGPMVTMPVGLPMYTHDLKQEFDRQDATSQPIQVGDEHHALADARWSHQLAKQLGIVT